MVVKRNKKEINWKRFQCELHIAQTQTNNDTLTHSAVVVVAFHPSLEIKWALTCDIKYPQRLRTFLFYLFHLFLFHSSFFFFVIFYEKISTLTTFYLYFAFTNRMIPFFAQLFLRASLAFSNGKIQALIIRWIESFKKCLYTILLYVMYYVDIS